MPTPGAVPATTGRRLMASVLDAVACTLLGGAFVVAGLLALVPTDRTAAELARGGSGTTALVGGALVLVAFGLVQWWTTAVHGFTVGKRLVGLRVLDAGTGRPVGVGRALVRGLLVSTAWAVPVVGPLVLLASSSLDPAGRRRGWHDRAAGSAVLDVVLGVDPATPTVDATRRLDSLLHPVMAEARMNQHPEAAAAVPQATTRVPLPHLAPDTDVIRSVPRELALAGVGTSASATRTGSAPTRRARHAAPAQHPGGEPSAPRADVTSADATPSSGSPSADVPPADEAGTDAPSPATPSPAAPSPAAPVVAASPSVGDGSPEGGPHEGPVSRGLVEGVTRIVPAADEVHTARPFDSDAADEDIESTRLRPARAKVPERAVDPTRVAVELSDGRRVLFTGTALVGRNPSPRPGERDATLITVSDPGRSVSKTHLLIRADHDGLWVTDRASTNGTVVTLPDGQQILCGAEQQVRVPVGVRVTFGDYGLTVTRPDAA